MPLTNRTLLSAAKSKHLEQSNGPTSKIYYTSIAANHSNPPGKQLQIYKN